MAKKAIDLGPVGKRVAENIARLRRSHGLDQKDLSQQLGKCGRPMQPQVISKIENGDRRVDVDDLVALALALDVTPNRLLLTGEAGIERLQLTTTISVTEDAAWRWACGEHDLFPLDAPTPLHKVLRFMAVNRPHKAGQLAILDRELAERPEVLAPIAHAARAVMKQGVSLQTIIDYLLVTDALDRAAGDREA